MVDNEQQAGVTEHLDKKSTSSLSVEPPVVEPTRSTSEIYFGSMFFQKIWPKLMGDESAVPDLTAAKGNPEATAQTLWASMGPAIDRLAERHALPVQRQPDQTDMQFFESLVAAMYKLDCKETTPDRTPQWNAWPSAAMETGATNCSFGSQVLGHVLRNAGYQVEYGMPGPLSHAIVFARDGENNIFYLDQANGVTARVVGEEVVGGIRAYRIETDLDAIPFRLVPVCTLEQSTFTTISNLGSLRQEGVTDVKTGALSKAGALMSAYDVTPRKDDPTEEAYANMQYSDNAMRMIIPEWDGIYAKPEWQEEHDESSRRIGESIARREKAQSENAPEIKVFDT